MASQFLGTSLKPTSTRRSTIGARQPLQVRADFGRLTKLARPKSSLSKKDADTIKRGEQGQVKKAGKLLPKKEGYIENKPKQAAKLFNARNNPRGQRGGAAGGAPWVPISKDAPGYRGIPKSIDPLIFVGGLIAVYVAAAVSLVAQG